VAVALPAAGSHHGEPMIWWSVFAVAVLVGLFGDVAMKQAGIGGVRWGWLASGFSAYSATSFAWFWLLRTRTLSSFGTLYPVANAIGLVVLGAVVFHETISPRAWLGIGVGCLALWLLSDH
jgi:drug/metabolite transporter (DMT)-like permease